MDLDKIYTQLQSSSDGIIKYATDALRQIRTGKASPSLVEDLDVLAYGGQSRLKLRELASIATEGPTTIVIDPFDATVVQDIEKAIHASPMGLSPSVDGKIIRILTPPLTEDQRSQFSKLASQKIEEAKIQIRRMRDTSRKQVKSLIDEKAITEDDKFRSEKEIDKITKDYADKLDDLRTRKHEEIMSI